MFRSYPALWTLLAGLGLCTSHAAAQSPAPPAAPAPSAAAIDPAARTLIAQAVAAHQALSALSATITVTSTGGGPLSTPSTVTLAFRQPSLVKATVADMSGPVSEFVSDGKTLTICNVRGKKYRAVPAPADASAITTVLGASHSLIALLFSRPALLNELLAQNGVTVSLGSPETINGVPTDTLKAVLLNSGAPGGKGLVTLSFGASDHLLRRLSMSMNLAGSGTLKTSTVTEAVMALSSAPVLTGADFAFTPPPGVLLDTAVPAKEPPMHDPRLVPGAKPFAVAAKDLSGRPLSLAQYRGKVVLMDFWATWCGPCVGEMPNVVAAYKKYHAAGFDIVGISLDQSRPALTAFVAQNKMPWRQVFDGKGWNSAVPGQYGVRAIPFGLLIGRDGKIAAVDVRGPALTAAIETALAK